MTYEPLDPNENSNKISDKAGEISAQESEVNSGKKIEQQDSVRGQSNTNTPSQQTAISSQQLQRKKARENKVTQPTSGLTPPPPIQSEDESSQGVIEPAQQEQKVDEVKNPASPVFPPKASEVDQPDKSVSENKQNYQEIKEGVETPVGQNNEGQNANNLIQQQKPNKNKPAKINNVNSVENSPDRQNSKTNSNLNSNNSVSNQ